MLALEKLVRLCNNGLHLIHNMVQSATTYNTVMKINLEEIPSKNPGKWFQYEILSGHTKDGELETQIDKHNGEVVFTIYKLIIYDNYRRKGYGSEAIHMCEEMAKVQNLSKIYVRPKAIDRVYLISEDNIRAFYEKNGFVLDNDEQLMYKSI